MSSKKIIEEIILKAQRNEITEHLIYSKLAKWTKDSNNKEVLEKMAKDELRHYDFWRKFTNRELRPSRLKLWQYLVISKMFGMTFGMRLMERSEEKAQSIYEKISEVLPDVKHIVKDEDEHERQLMNLINEDRLRYVGSMVLGLNDALVELLGALAGFTFTLENVNLIAVTGLVVGVAGSLSMATSEYLSTKSESDERNPLRASLYTGIAYILTVLFLISPYFFIPNAYVCLGLTIFFAITIIFLFNFYVSVVKGVSLKKRFFEMVLISLGIACITFMIGFLMKVLLKIDV